MPGPLCPRNGLALLILTAGRSNDARVRGERNPPPQRCCARGGDRNLPNYGRQNQQICDDQHTSANSHPLNVSSKRGDERRGQCQFKIMLSRRLSYRYRVHSACSAHLPASSHFRPPVYALQIDWWRSRLPQPQINALHGGWQVGRKSINGMFDPVPAFVPPTRCRRK
jgi:hypothetical protein